MSTLTSFKILLFITFLAISLMLVSMPAEAASCKGKTKSACSSATDCSWVDGFKRKDGVKVSAHCRSKSGKAGNSAKSKKSAGPSGKAKKARESANRTSSKVTKESKMKTSNKTTKAKKEKVKKSKKDKMKKSVKDKNSKK